MYYARVIGNIVSTIKYKGLKGKKIQVIQPVDMETGKDSGSFLALYLKILPFQHLYNT